MFLEPQRERERDSKSAVKSTINKWALLNGIVGSDFFCKLSSQRAECLQFAWGSPWQGGHISFSLGRQTGVSAAQSAGTCPQCQGLGHSTPCRSQWQCQTCPQVSQPAGWAWTLCAQGQLCPDPALLNSCHGHSSNWAVKPNKKPLLFIFPVRIYFHNNQRASLEWLGYLSALAFIQQPLYHPTVKNQLEWTDLTAGERNGHLGSLMKYWAHFGFLFFPG